MDPNELRDILLNFPAVTEEEPFGPNVVVYKVLGKMYALSTYETPLKVNLKCDAGQAVTLRDTYEAVNPGYHMNKKHWNTVTLDGSVPRSEVQAMIQHSFDLVVQGMSRKDQEKVKEQSTHGGNRDNDWREEFLRDISR